MNRRNRLLAVAATTATLALSGCTTPAGPNEQGAMIIGGVLGGLLGKQVGGGRGRTVATIVGTIVGAQIGGNIGRSMDETDQLKTAHSLETVRTGVPTTWRNPDTQNRYTVTPTRTYEAGTGPCREYTVDAVIGGKVEQVYGKACRQPDGSWKTVN